MICDNIKYTKRTTCALCNKETEEIINLPKYPLTDFYTDKPNDREYSVDQKLLYCDDCNHYQLEKLIDKAFLYGDLYSYRTVKSEGARSAIDYFKDKMILPHIKGKKFTNIIEIGCNSDYLIKQLSDYGENLIGIDPVLEPKEEGKLKLVRGFYNDYPVDTSNSLIITNQVMEHLENPRDFIKTLLKKADSNTLFCFCFPCFNKLVDEDRFEEIYHHHLHYFTEFSVINMLSMLGCEVLEYGYNDNFWGSIMVVFRKNVDNKPILIHSASKVFKYDVKDKYESYCNKTRLISNNMNIKDNYYGYGAGLQFATQKYYIYSLGRLKYILDDDKSKDGLYYPGTDIQIRYAGDIDIKDKNIVITANYYTRAILNNIIKKKPKKIITGVNYI